MKHVKRISAAGLACICLLIPGAAIADEHAVDSYCSPSGDYCTAVIRSHGRTKFVVRTLSFTGEYRLCVRLPAGSRECGDYRMNAVKHGIYASRIDFARNFAAAASGTYTVSWHYEGFRLGPSLHFRKS